VGNFFFFSPMKVKLHSHRLYTYLTRIEPSDTP
jgi:hypothetical protein